MKTYHFFTGTVTTALVALTLFRRHDVTPGVRSRIRRNLQDVPNIENEITVAKSMQVLQVRKYAKQNFGISEIVHDPAKREVAVTFNRLNEKCTNPILFGRLSGRALTLLRWEGKQDNIMKGYYDIPFSGPFFIEINILFCHYDDSKMDNCMIPAESNRVTIYDAEIITETSTPLKGYWYNSWGSNEHTRLRTRWQPFGCRDSDRKFCEETTSINRYDRYSFVTNDAALEKALSTVDFKLNWRRESKSGYNCYRDTEEKCKVCTVGASHSARLNRFLTAAAGVEKVGNAKVQRPEMIDEEMARYIMDRCENLVIGFGQHDLKYGMTPTVLFGEKMRRLLSLFRSHPRVFVRSMHYNPLGDEKLMCPPEDSRNPYLIDQYNTVLSELCKQFGIPWIDTRWIDGPMWDSGEDWNHLHFSVEIVQAFYVAQVVGL